MGLLISATTLAAFIWMIVKIVRDRRKDLDYTYRIYGGYKGYKDYLAASRRGLGVKLNAPRSDVQPSESVSEPGGSGPFDFFEPGRLLKGSLFGNRRHFIDSVNPATGLPMTGNVDTDGNPYGSDINEDR